MRVGKLLASLTRPETNVMKWMLIAATKMSAHVDHIGDTPTELPQKILVAGKLMYTRNLASTRIHIARLPVSMITGNGLDRLLPVTMDKAPLDLSADTSEIAVLSFVESKVSPAAMIQADWSERIDLIAQQELQFTLHATEELDAISVDAKHLQDALRFVDGGDVVLRLYQKHDKPRTEYLTIEHADGRTAILAVKVVRSPRTISLQELAGGNDDGETE